MAKSLKQMQEGSLKKRIKALKEKTLRDLVYFKGGRFWMGDFGQWHSPDGLPYTPDQDNKPPFQVELDGFSIGKYKISYAEYDIYTDVMKLPRIADNKINPALRHPSNPVGVSWSQAKDYCIWLAKITGLPFDLPTEAQWEYAARSGGQCIVFATDNGSLEEGRNVPTYKQISKLQLVEDSGIKPYPIGIFPATPIGLYDLAKNGREWVNDWYGPYPHTIEPVKNPSGPAEGIFKVQRSSPNQDSYAALTMERRKTKPVAQPYDLMGELVQPGQGNDSFRIALQTDKAIQLP